MSNVSTLLKDVVFLSAVLMKGRYVTTAKVGDRPQLEALIRNRLAKGLYLLTTRSGTQSLRVLVANGRIVGAVLESQGSVVEGDEAIDKGVQGEVSLNVFEITDDVLSFVPNAKKVLESVLSAVPKAASPPAPAPAPQPPAPAPTPPSPPTPAAEPPRAMERELAPPAASAEAVAASAGAVAEEARGAERLRGSLSLLETEIPRALDPLGVRVSRASAKISGGDTIDIYVKVSNIPPPEVTPEVVSWVAMSKVYTILGASIEEYDVIVEVETPHQGSSRFHYITPVDKVSTFIHGVVTQILFSHSIVPHPSRVKIDPDTKFVEALYSVRARRKDIALSSSMLTRLATECVRIVKNVFPGRVRIRLRAGFLTEGRAEG